MSESKTHLQIDHTLCGTPTEIGEGAARVRFVPTKSMQADDQGLIHGGFVFGAVDYAAMLAVNDPNVVLGSADVRFVAPVKLGDEVVATARVIEEKGKKRVLEVAASVADTQVVAGMLVAFVLPKHVLA